MGNSISSFITKLVPLINKEREGLLFIDGRWGSGKTYFIHNRLKSYYSDQPIFYISLLGITSLADFKSKIIECYYLEGAENLANDFNSLADGVSLLRGKADESGVLRSFFSSIGTSVKGKVLSSLSGLFILDDIERMNDNELTSNILNYCHSLYFQRENRSLDFIVIG
ncbi:KAP family NTPase, partial [Citrobacter cronae]